MSIETLTNEERLKLKRIIDDGVKIKQECADLMGGLKDAAKALAEELNLKPAIINKAINAAFKANLDETKQAVDDVEEVLTLTGHR